MIQQLMGDLLRSFGFSHCTSMNHFFIFGRVMSPYIVLNKTGDWNPAWRTRHAHHVLLPCPYRCDQIW